MRLTPRTSATLKLIALIAMIPMILPTVARAASKYKVLYAFKGGNDGDYPSGALVLDDAGNLYGVTVSGGGDQQNCSGLEPGCGTVFMLTPNSNGKWKENVLHRFQSGNNTSDGSAPNGALFSMGLETFMARPLAAAEPTNNARAAHLQAVASSSNCRQNRPAAGKRLCFTAFRSMPAELAPKVAWSSTKRETFTERLPQRAIAVIRSSVGAPAWFFS